MGGYGGARMKVFLDKKRLQVNSFKDYMGMYDGMETPVVFETIGDRWEVRWIRPLGEGGLGVGPGVPCLHEGICLFGGFGRSAVPLSSFASNTPVGWTVFLPCTLWLGSF